MKKDVTIEVTTFCGADCVMCVRKDYIVKSRHMDFLLFQKCIQKISSYGFNSVVFGGTGDPLAHPRIVDMLSYIKQEYPNISIRLTSTCHLLNKHIMPEVCNFVDVLKISNYGASKEVFEKVHRGNITFEIVHENLINLFSYNGKKPYVILNYLLIDENKGDLKPWLNKWRRTTVDEINVWQIHNWAGYKQASGTNIMKDIKACSRVLEKHVAIWVDGKVSACCFDCECQLLLGDLAEKSFLEVFSSVKYKFLYKVHTSNSVIGSGLICEKCDQISSRDYAMIYKEQRGQILKNNIMEGL